MDAISKQVGVLPLVKHYMKEMNLHEIFDRHIPNANGAEIKPAQVLCTVVTNILAAAKPLYHIEEWLIGHMDGQTEEGELVSKYNDDRCGRNLDLLHDTNRGSILTETVAAATRVHDLETSHIHNDSTTITFAGANEEQSQEAVQIEYGHNKDHRPDHKQIVFGLNTTADGHIPIGYHLYDGSTADVVTQQPNENYLRALLVKEVFTYIADCKLFSIETLRHINSHGGIFITLVPRNIKAIKGFIKNVKAEAEIPWELGYTVSKTRKKDRNVQTISIS